MSRVSPRQFYWQVHVLCEARSESCLSLFGRFATPRGLHAISLSGMVSTSQPQKVVQRFQSLICVQASMISRVQQHFIHSSY